MPIKIKSTGGGSVSIDVPNTGSDFTLTAPANNSTLFTTDGGTITGNVAFTSNNVTIGGSAISPTSGMRNRIINGDMRIDQRNNGSLVTVNSDGFVNRAFPADRFTIQKSGACVLTGQRTANGVSDFVNSIRTTVTTADSSISGSDYAFVQTRLEGFFTSDMLFGTAFAKTITLSFWVRSSITGPFYIVFANYSDNRSYPARYTINLANTWEYKTITIPGDTTGTWFTDNSGGLNIAWMIGSGSFGTANAWQGLVLGASDQTQLISTVNATFDLTGVQLEIGTVATPFERRPFGMELALCQRYYEDSGNAAYNVVGPYTYSTNQLIRVPVLYKVTKRSSCTLTINDDNGNANRIYRNGTNRTFSIWLNTPYVFSIANTDTPSGSTDDIAFRWTSSAEL